MATKNTEAWKRRAAVVTNSAGLVRVLFASQVTRELYLQNFGAQLRRCVGDSAPPARRAT